ncbi:MAG: hypothetical protein NTW86_23990, partial [Candidatus Sumerlaeota bacterium]|nr:hypothetical protein [Candidatus Sumerlaeota bacterium]
GAGAYSFSENALYTMEAWKLFLSRLKDNGLFSVSRWHSAEHIGETGRVLGLAVATLLDMGVPDPASHLALVTIDRISTLIITKQPFTPEEIARLTTRCSELQFAAACYPGRLPDDPVLRAIVASRDRSQLDAAVAGAELNCAPSTDDNPYFFNMLRLRNIRLAFVQSEGIINGNLLATLSLLGLVLALFIVAMATIALPLVLRGRFGLGPSAPGRTLRAGALYFSLIGAGFMLAEIALIQRLTVFLGHPIYALGVLLFTLILSTGLGSLISDRLPLTRPPWVYLYPLAALGALLLLSVSLSPLLGAMAGVALGGRIAASIAIIAPLGALLGLFFPTGMRMVRAASATESPWYWALNGIFGVLCSALAVFISIYAGISTNLVLAGLCYGGVILAQRGLAGEARVKA